MFFLIKNGHLPYFCLEHLGLLLCPLPCILFRWKQYRVGIFFLRCFFHICILWFLKFCLHCFVLWRNAIFHHFWVFFLISVTAVVSHFPSYTTDYSLLKSHNTAGVLNIPFPFLRRTVHYHNLLTNICPHSGSKHLLSSHPAINLSLVNQTNSLLYRRYLIKFWYVELIIQGICLTKRFFRLKGPSLKW